MTIDQQTEQWWDQEQWFPGAESQRTRRLYFGAPRFDGSRNHVEIRQPGGPGFVPKVDRFNPWRDGRARAGLLLDGTAQDCREAAALLLQAADIIDAANGDRQGR